MEIAGRDTGMVAGRHRPSGQRRPIDRLFRLQTPRFWGGTGPGGCWPDPTLIFFCQKRGESTRKAPVIGPALLFSKTPTRGSSSASLSRPPRPGWVRALTRLWELYFLFGVFGHGCTPAGAG